MHVKSVVSIVLGVSLQILATDGIAVSCPDAPRSSLVKYIIRNDSVRSKTTLLSGGSQVRWATLNMGATWVAYFRNNQYLSVMDIGGGQRKDLVDIRSLPDAGADGVGYMDWPIGDWIYFNGGGNGKPHSNAISPSGNIIFNTTDAGHTTYNIKKWNKDTLCAPIYQYNFWCTNMTGVVCDIANYGWTVGNGCEENRYSVNSDEWFCYNIGYYDGFNGKDGRFMRCGGNQVLINWQSRKAIMVSFNPRVVPSAVADVCPNLGSLSLEQEVKAAIILFHGILDEKQRRLHAGLESIKQGRGGDAIIARLLDIDAHTVAKGRMQLLEADVEMGRVRKPGAGRTGIKKNT